MNNDCLSMIYSTEFLYVLKAEPRCSAFYCRLSKTIPPGYAGGVSEP